MASRRTGIPLLWRPCGFHRCGRVRRRGGIEKGRGMSSAGVALIDGSLVTRSQAGDQDAISELATQVRPMVQRYASRFFSDPARAEDLAQTALMKAFARVGDVRSPGAFQAWLLRIARNECLNEL